MLEQHITNLVDSLAISTQHTININFDKRVSLFNKLSEIKKNIIGIDDQPILNVILHKTKDISLNDYNPNFVASPEMKLLTHSIQKDGFTMPIVVGPTGDNTTTIIDGHHRFTLMEKKPYIASSLQGYIPTVSLKRELPERMSATVRHNLAKGQHQVELTSQLVLRLRNLNWSNDTISRELGMDKDEILRMLQVTGLVEAFENNTFSNAWV